LGQLVASAGARAADVDHEAERHEDAHLLVEAGGSLSTRSRQLGSQRDRLKFIQSHL
jgi:hypothetical protein